MLLVPPCACEASALWFFFCLACRSLALPPCALQPYPLFHFPLRATSSFAARAALCLFSLCPACCASRALPVTHPCRRHPSLPVTHPAPSCPTCSWIA